jgi:predicted nucleic acid-binding protein
MFDKIDSIDLLNLIFKDKIVITPRIRDEILAPLTYGYTFPLTVVSTIKTVPLTHKALAEYVQFQENVTLGRGEPEAIACCRAEKCS